MACGGRRRRRPLRSRLLLYAGCRRLQRKQHAAGSWVGQHTVGRQVGNLERGGAGEG